MFFAASSLRFDNSYYDDRVWDGLLKAYNFPDTIKLRDFFDVIDEEHDRPGHDLTGGYRNIDEDKQKIGQALVDELKKPGVGQWAAPAVA